MPSLRLLNEWPWGCAGDFTSLPGGPSDVDERDYWLTASSLSEAMRWYYKISSWEFSFQVIDTLKNPISFEATTIRSFNSETDVVCGRNGIKVTVDTGPWPGVTDGSISASATFWLFGPQPPLLQKHSVLLIEEEYRFLFRCKADISFITAAGNPGGFVFVNTSTGGVRRNIIDLIFDGRQVLTATGSFFGEQALIKVTPKGQFSFL
jgi:hypothetical protein